MKPCSVRNGLLSGVLLLALLCSASLRAVETLRPPSVPLVACDPYFSIWSPSDTLPGSDTTHWTGKPHRLNSLVRIDGHPFRLMGKNPAQVPALPQVSLEVLPTRTIYTFSNESVRLTFTFLTAALPQDIDLLSRPVTYLTWAVESADGKPHSVEVYFDASSELAVNQASQQVAHSTETLGDIRALKIGSVDQPVLGKRGDDVRIDWGYLYVAAPPATDAKLLVARAESAGTDFAREGASFTPGSGMPSTGPGDAFAATVTFSISLSPSKPESRWLMLAYDDLYSIQYMKKNLRPYWRRNGWEAADLLKAAAGDYPALNERCRKFDQELMADLTAAGGEKYARICALAYRQCLAAGKFVADSNGQPLQFCKENHSNGCIGTSDVFYPMAPQFLLFGPSLAKSFIVPFMNYATSERWTFPFAPHDMGTYPHANGQVYGDGERGENNQMPVEETGNLMILMAAVAQMEGNADFAGAYWPQLQRWADYLKQKGFDPENQLCTDDFAGHMAHNVNLSAKAICGLGAFGKLCDMRGDHAKAAEYSKLAKQFAQRWLTEADAGDHYRLAFDKPDSWSQKYNAAWDRILGLNLWPANTWRKEMDFYKKTLNTYGLPLDNRKAYTKLDWIIWTATLTQDRADFDALVAPVFRYLNETSDRAPMSDWYQTKDARKVGFTARPVVGGVFLPLLYNKTVWSKWAGRDQVHAANWAPIPKRPQIKVIVPAADSQAATWRYTFRQPGSDWYQAVFNDTGWQSGQSGFGTRETPGARVHTAWNTGNIWLRREITLQPADLKDVQAWMHHDEDAEVYINGVLAIKVGGFSTGYDMYDLSPAGRAALKPGKNIIAIHCRQTSGGQYVDLGLATLKTP